MTQPWSALLQPNRTQERSPDAKAARIWSLLLQTFSALVAIPPCSIAPLAVRSPWSLPSCTLTPLASGSPPRRRRRSFPERRSEMSIIRPEVLAFVRAAQALSDDETDKILNCMTNLEKVLQHGNRPRLEGDGHPRSDGHLDGDEPLTWFP